MRKKMTGDGEVSFAILCDFDGTVCPTQMMDFLYQHFAACGMEYAERWERGEISTQEEIESTFGSVSASREEMEAGVTGDSGAALMALLTNPLVPSFEIAKALLDDMLPANKDYLPQFYPQGG
jgi:hypothetical protein